MIIDTSRRSSETEIMDDLQMEGELLRNSLDKLDWINKWLGGNRVTMNGFKKLISITDKNKTIKIIDIGCGSGDMLRIVADYMRREGRSVQIIGIDANQFTVDYARKQSEKYPEITYECHYVTAELFGDLDFDILLSTLFLHHLSDEDIVSLLTTVTQKAKLGILVNDLQRSQIAYFLFNALCLFISNPMIKQDGLTSITRGFRKDDLERYAESAQLNNSTISWCWAFRYQWIIRTVNA